MRVGGHCVPRCAPPTPSQRRASPSTARRPERTSAGLSAPHQGTGRSWVRGHPFGLRAIILHGRPETMAFISAPASRAATALATRRSRRSGAPGTARTIEIAARCAWAPALARLPLSDTAAHSGAGDKKIVIASRRRRSRSVALCVDARRLQLPAFRLTLRSIRSARPAAVTTSAACARSALTRAAVGLRPRPGA